jgi:hypothetical protein
MAERSFVYKPPVEAVGDAAPVRLARVRRAIAVATVAAFLLGSKPLLAWTNELPISPVSDFLLYLAQAWQDEAESGGLTRYADWIQHALRAFEAWR